MLMISHHSCGRLKDGLLTLCCRVLHNAVYLLCTVGELLTLSVFNAALTGSDTGAVGHSEIGNRLSWIRLLWRRQFHIPLLRAVCMSLCGPLKKKKKKSLVIRWERLDSGLLSEAPSVRLAETPGGRFLFITLSAKSRRECASTWSAFSPPFFFNSTSEENGY